MIAENLLKLAAATIHNAFDDRDRIMRRVRRIQAGGRVSASNSIARDLVWLEDDIDWFQSTALDDWCGGFERVQPDDIRASYLPEAIEARDFLWGAIQDRPIAMSKYRMMTGRRKAA